MRVCEIVWDVGMADRVQEMEEAATGMPSPCRVGRICPFLPADVVLVPRADAQAHSPVELRVKAAVEQAAS